MYAGSGPSGVGSSTTERGEVIEHVQETSVVAAPCVTIVPDIV